MLQLGNVSEVLGMTTVRCCRIARIECVCVCVVISFACRVCVGGRGMWAGYPNARRDFAAKHRRADYVLHKIYTNTLPHSLGKFTLSCWECAVHRHFQVPHTYTQYTVITAADFYLVLLLRLVLVVRRRASCSLAASFRGFDTR